MKIQGFIPLNIINTKEVNDILSKLNMGDKLNVQVVGINNNELTLHLPNGTNINATLLAELSVNLGDFLELGVKSKSESQVVLETVKSTENEPKMEDIRNTLLNLKVNPDERNTEIAKNIVQEKLQLTKENIQKVISVLPKLEMDIKSAVFFVANNLNEVHNSEELLSKFTKNEVKVSDMMGKLESLIINNNQDKLMQNVIKDYNNETTKQNIVKYNANKEDIITKMAGFVGTEKKTNEIAKDIIKNLGSTIKLSDNIEILFSQSQKSENLETEQPNVKNMELFKENNLPAPTINKEVVGEVKTIIISKGVINEDTLESIYKVLDPKIAEFIKNNPAVKKELLKLINKDNTNILLNTSDLEDLKIVHKDISTTVKEFFKMPSLKMGIKSEIDVNKLYNEINLKLDTITNNIDKLPEKSAQTITNIISEVKDTINFLNNVNNNYLYFQVPIVFNNKVNDVEIYISKRDKKTKIDPKNATLYVSLDTNNMGVVDLLIDVNMNNINFSFKLDDEKTVQYVKSNIEFLNELISSIGYNISKIDYKVKEQKSNIVSTGEILKQYKSGKNAVDIKV